MESERKATREECKPPSCRGDRLCRSLLVAASLLGGLPFVVFGIYLLLHQHYKTSTCEPVAAQLFRHEIRPVEDGYEYLVAYRYEVAGRQFNSDNLFATELMIEAPDRQWWDGLRDGAKVQAFYDPADPARAFLTTKDLFPPCMFVFIGMGTVTFGLGVFGLVMSKLPARTKRRGAIALAILWYGIGIATCAYYYSAVGLADFSKNPGRPWWMLLYGTLGLVPLLAGLPNRTGRLGCAVTAIPPP